MKRLHEELFCGSGWREWVCFSARKPGGVCFDELRLNELVSSCAETVLNRQLISVGKILPVNVGVYIKLVSFIMNEAITDVTHIGGRSVISVLWVSHSQLSKQLKVELESHVHGDFSLWWRLAARWPWFLYILTLTHILKLVFLSACFSDRSSVWTTVQGRLKLWNCHQKCLIN